jgi:hypothetical protein
MSAMFHMHPVVAAVMADRQREIEQRVRVRRLLEASYDADRPAATSNRGPAASAPVRPIAARPAEPNGAA